MKRRRDHKCPRCGDIVYVQEFDGLEYCVGCGKVVVDCNCKKMNA